MPTRCDLEAKKQTTGVVSVDLPEEEDMGGGGMTPRGERLGLCPAGHPQHCPFNLGPVLKMPRVLCCLVGAGREG